MSFDYEAIVRKATSSKASAPKRKHVRTLILETWKGSSVSPILNELFRRPLETNEVVCWKALVTLHTLLQEGHKRVVHDAYYRISTLTSLRGMVSRSSTRGFPQLISLYITFVVDKLNFHHTHPEFQGDFNLEAFQKLLREQTFQSSKLLSVVNNMMELQTSIYQVHRGLMEQKDFSDCKVSCLIPLVLESYNLYTIETFLIRKLVDEVDSMDVLSVLIEQFYSQYIMLRTFYSEVNEMKAVSSIIAVPMLPKDPPVFIARKVHKKRSSMNIDSPSAVRKAQPLVQEQPPVTPPASSSTPMSPSNPFANNPFAPTVHKQASWVTFDNANDLGFHSSSTPTTPSIPHPVITNPFTPPPTPVVQEQKDRNRSTSTPTPVNADFASLLNMVNSIKPTQDQKKKKEEEDRKKREEEQKYLEALKKEQEIRERKAKQEQEARLKREQEEKERREKEERDRKEQERARQEQERAKKEEERLQQERERIQQIVLEQTSQEIKDLKLKIVELEGLLQKEREKNKEANKEIATLQSELIGLQSSLEKEREKSQQLQAQLEAREAQFSVLSADQQRLQSDHQSLAERLEDLARQKEEEALRILAKEMAAAQDFMNMYLARLDSPTNLGNEGATREDVVNDTTKIAGAVERLMNACISGSREEIIDALKAISAVSIQLFDDSKGIARKIEVDEDGTGADVRQRLLDAVRSTGNVLSRLLATVKNIGGAVEDDEDKQAIQADHDEFNQRVKDIVASVDDVQRLEQERAQGKRTQQDESDDLELLAEKELLAAAKAIEQAAQSLLVAKAQPKPQNTIPSVADAILDAAMAITKATALLVNAAASAQKELVEKGRMAATQSQTAYKKDATWSQGLISAAKAVAGATQTLITTANDVVQGKIDEENVIAASKAVASSTAQLVAATRVKADDLNSPPQLALNQASRAVTNATQQLVAAARAAIANSRDAQAQEVQVGSEFQKKVKEMEIQAHILKLEKEMQAARNQLFTLRKQEYK
eukprot:CAMPEP_0168548420 /NCGR_PEP_ID=MMETSP0413-20121227/4549_1 /TAXON_ID=136452 /ORGANISM="Filamoeba nolandi, Strain NC-AS-23-1" /LENGTH=999 /DNA_ID=CAMNT_0008578717 /DNA_START=91 /DNA_END=3090 /DNA_ORIENTATION=+